MANQKRPETEEQFLLRKEKEAIELVKWEKEKQRPKMKGYAIYILMIIMLVQCIDNISTSINTQMQSLIAIGLFGDRLSIMSLLTGLTMPILILSIFYKALSDRYGRKIFLCINAFGMAAGLLATYLAGVLGGLPGIVVYIIAAAVINFFITNDMQVLFIMETSDPKKRATNFALVNAVGILSVVLIPLMRQAFMGDDISRWNHVYIVPSAVGFIICLICLLFARESDVFLDSRIRYLKMTDKERKEEAERKGREEAAVKAQGGVGTALRFAFKDMQLRWLFTAVIVFGLSAFGLQYYEKIADVYFSTEEVTNVLTFYPFSAAAITFLNGVIGDKLGRKRSVVTMSALSFIGFTIFFAGCSFHWSTAIVGLAIGLYCGASWGVTDMCTIIAGESTPTNLRGSMMSVSTIMNMLSKMIAMLIPMVALLITHDDYRILGILCIAGVIPLLAVSLIILITKVKDTTGQDLRRI